MPQLATYIAFPGTAMAPWGDHDGQVFDKFRAMWSINVPAQHG